MGYGLILNNAYHLYLRPAHKIEELGGVHGFTGMARPITDSGGFQVFSLAKFCKVADEGDFSIPHRRIVASSARKRRSRFRKRWGGHHHGVRSRRRLCRPRPGAPTPRTSLLWARRCVSAKRRTDQSLFGIVQGGWIKACGVESAPRFGVGGLTDMRVGGLSVREDKADMYAMLDVTVPELPSNKPGGI